MPADAGSEPAAVPLHALVALGSAATALEPWGPRVGADVGDPQTFGVELFATDGSSGAGPAVQAGIWECTPGGWPIVDRPDTETMHLVAGRIVITDADGTAHRLGAGDTFVLPKGWSGRWDVLETVRKIYVINS
jgi:uncharacterized cupin superfamily protein